MDADDVSIFFKAKWDPFPSRLQAEKADREAIAASVDRISVLQGKLEMLLVMRVVDSREVLSPEEDERLLYLIRCSMKPGCVGKENCPAQKKRKEESE